MALARYEGTAVNTAGDVIPNATVEVRRDQPGRPVVPLWSDRDGVVPLGNPIQTDAEGAFAFHVLGGVYYIRIYTGPSQQPTFQKVLRYVAIGTAAERDVEDLASALEAGTATFPTLAELEAFVPEVAGVGGKVTTGADAGLYHYDDVAEEWVFDRYLYDTMARMNVTGGTADAIEAEIVPGVPSASVVMLWIEAPATNTGAVTINGTPVLNTNEEELSAGQWVEGRTYWFSDEVTFYKLRTDSDVSDLVAQAEAAAGAAQNAQEAAEVAAAGAGVTDGDKGGIVVSAAGTDWQVKDGDKGDVTVSDDGTVWTINGGFAGFISGLTLSNSVGDVNNDIDFAAGVAVANDGITRIHLESSLTKRLDAAWSVGAGQGGLFSGSKANSTWYHCFGILRPDTGVVDAGFDTSPVAANRPSDYTLYRRLGSVLTDGSGNILAFVQIADEFWWVSPTLDVDVSDLGTSAVSYQLKTPSGVITDAIIEIGLSNGTANTFLMLSPLFRADQAPLSRGASGTFVANDASTTHQTTLRVITNTSQQIRARSNRASTALDVATLGWRDFL